MLLHHKILMIGQSNIIKSPHFLITMMEIKRNEGFVLNILEFILKYWIQVLFGLMVAAIGIFWKRIKAWREAYKKKEAEALKDSIIAEVKVALEDLTKRSDANDKIIRQEMDGIRAGLLTIQGVVFKNKCRQLLKEDCKISLEQFENLQSDHAAYNALGGNHTGDELFKLVQKKFENQL